MADQVETLDEGREDADLTITGTESAESLKPFAWVRWIGIGMIRAGRHRCSRCDKKRLLFHLAFAAADPVRMSPDLCLTCWRIRG